jgi:hypothetical protein
VRPAAKEESSSRDSNTGGNSNTGGCPSDNRQCLRYSDEVPTPTSSAPGSLVLFINFSLFFYMNLFHTTLARGQDDHRTKAYAEGPFETEFSSSNSRLHHHPRNHAAPLHRPPEHCPNGSVTWRRGPKPSIHQVKTQFLRPYGSVRPSSTNPLRSGAYRPDAMVNPAEESVIIWWH